MRKATRLLCERREGPLRRLRKSDGNLGIAAGVVHDAAGSVRRTLLGVPVRKGTRGSRQDQDGDSIRTTATAKKCICTQRTDAPPTPHARLLRQALLRPTHAAVAGCDSMS